MCRRGNHTGEQKERKVTEPHLGSDLQRSFSGFFGTDGELGRLVDQAAGLLDPWPESLDLHVRALATAQYWITWLLNSALRLFFIQKTIPLAAEINWSKLAP